MQWFGRIARVNIVAALALIVAIAAALTPVLSPYRLSANSQYGRALAGDLKGKGEGEYGEYGGTSRLYAGGHAPLAYLRFDSGDYGMRRLRELSATQSGKDPGRLRSLAIDMLARTNIFTTEISASARHTLFTNVRVFPSGRKVPEALIGRLDSDWHYSNNRAMSLPLNERGVVGVFVDLDGDGSEEFVLLGAGAGLVYREEAGVWSVAAQIEPGCCSDKDWKKLISELEAGDFTAKQSRWSDLHIGERVLRVQEQPKVHRDPPHPFLVAP